MTADLDIPQATLGRIRQIVDSVAAGTVTPKDLADREQISLRQVHYGASAAQTLGLLIRRTADTFALTALGRKLAAAAAESESAKAILREAIDQSPTIQTIAPELLGSSQPDRTLIAERISGLGKYSKDTSNHRAAMLLKWRTHLQDENRQNVKRSKQPPVTEERTAAQEMGISSVGIENYKSIRELKLDFQPLMIFVGPNAAGKTNLIQALSLVLDLQADGTTEPFELYGGFDQLVTRTKRRRHFIKFSLSAPLKRLAFRPAEPRVPVNFTLRYDLTLRAGSNVGEVRVDVESARILEAGMEVLKSNWKHGNLKEHNAPPAWGMTKEALSMRGGDPNTINLLWLLRSARFARLPQVTRLRLDASALRRDSQLTTTRHGRVLGPTGEGLPLAVERFKREGKLPGIIAGLQEVYPRIKNVDTVHPLPGQVALKFTEDGIDDGLGQSNVSDGIIHALAILIALESPGPLAIEEPENALHPWALRKLMEKMRNRKSSGPLFITTHSPTVVDCIEDPNDLFIVDNSVNAGTTVTRATCKEEALKNVMSESGQQLGQIWLDGSIGGVPGE